MASCLPLLLIAGCRHTEPPAAPADKLSLNSCKVALAAHNGEAHIDRDIQKMQEAIRAAREPEAKVERLGWLFVSKARSSHDDGYYKLAELCAACLQEQQPDSAAALLLRGHVLHSLHRFQEAETIARQLVKIRRVPFDYGLLGDVLMEQGRLDEAARAYQSMVDLKPSLQSYSRVGHLRWLKGDLEGATQMMEMAARAATPRDPESAAWVFTRLALLQLQAGEPELALRACDTALGFQKDYAPVLLARGRVLLSEARTEHAVEVLSRAAERNPLPEYQWWLAEALRKAGREQEASRIESRIAERGPTDDPRTVALFLATSQRDLDVALDLAGRELESRPDTFTLDAHAWSLFAAGRIDEASAAMELALAEGTQDARLYLHAGIIRAAAGEVTQAKGWFKKARAIRQMLLPSERQLLISKSSAIGMKVRM